MLRPKPLARHPLLLLGWLLLAISLGLVYIPAGRPAPARAQAGDTTLTINPSPLVVDTCGEVIAQVWVNDVTDLYGADVRLHFDPALLEVVDAEAATPGIQIENGGFLVNPWMLYHDANNTTGEIRYVATQLNPALPVSGSGALISIRFRARATGSAALDFTYSKLASRNGTTLPATTVNSSASITGPAAPAVTISRLDATTPHLSWTATAGLSYNIYRGTAAYFTPTDPPYATTTAGTFDDTGQMGSLTTHHYYVIKSACASGLVGAASNRVGEYAWPLRAVTNANFSDVSMDLNIPGVNSASALASYIGSSVIRVLRYRPALQGFQQYTVGQSATDFSLVSGQFVYVVTDNTAPTKFTMVGNVPTAGSLSFNLVSGSTAKYNFISLPLDSNLSSASAVAQSIGSSVVRVMRYQISAQGYQIYTPGQSTTDFSLAPGEPFVLLLGLGAPTQWP